MCCFDEDSSAKATNKKGLQTVAAVGSPRNDRAQPRAASSVARVAGATSVQLGGRFVGFVWGLAVGLGSVKYTVKLILVHHEMKPFR